MRTHHNSMPFTWFSVIRVLISARLYQAFAASHLPSREADSGAVIPSLLSEIANSSMSSAVVKFKSPAGSEYVILLQKGRSLALIANQPVA